MVRYTKVFLVFCIGLWGLMGALGNISDLGAVESAVRDVTSMSGVPDGVGPPWRTGNAIVVWIGVLLIVFGKVAAVIGGGYGGVLMLKAAKSSVEEFERAKRVAVAWCGITFGLLILSFTILAESAFFMFFNPKYISAGELAFRFAGSFALITLFVAQRETA